MSADATPAAEMIPTPDQIDAAWLCRVLAAAGHDLRPASVAVAPVGTGQLGETYRLSLTYGGSAPGPASLICKLAAADETSRATAQHWSLYAREVRFYQQLAAGARVDTPGFYAGALGADGRFFLLLEDLAPAGAGDQLRGMSVADAGRALREGARLHAAFWARGDDADLAWLETGRMAQPFYAPEVYRGTWPGFLDRYRDQLSADHVAVCEGFSTHYDAYARPLERPRCITHNDFRPDNMLYGAPGRDRMTIVDWQSAALGFNAVDVAYLVGGAFEPAARRACEAALLAIYHDELGRQGVAGYARADLERDYRHFTFAGINVAVVAAMLVRRTERGDRMFLTMLDRHVRHVQDAGAMALLRGAD